jgi:hypothetical protein
MRARLRIWGGLLLPKIGKPLTKRERDRVERTGRRWAGPRAKDTGAGEAITEGPPHPRPGAGNRIQKGRSENSGQA